MEREQQGRFEEQLERKNEEAARKAEEASARAHAKKIVEDPGGQDESSVRAKSSGHGQVTADKWNQ